MLIFINHSFEIIFILPNKIVIGRYEWFKMNDAKPLIFKSKLTVAKAKIILCFL